jgi:hypothetical protein
MEEVRIWAVNGTSDVVPLEARDRVDTESLLEETLVNNPQLLLTGLRLVGRQTPTDGGPLDLLGVDQDGKLVVFELKRGTLSRESVAQIIDYSSNLEAMDLAALADHIADRSGEHGIEAIEDFQEWYSQDFGGLEGLKPLRMFLVGLGADDRTRRMVDFLANNSAMDISLLTFHGFSYDGKTFLAKQVEVDAADETDRRPTRRYVRVAERRERLEQGIEESGVSDTFEAARVMFQESWPGSRPRPGALGLNIPLSGRGASYARIGARNGRISMVFFPWAKMLCLDEFKEPVRKIQHQTWPKNREPLDPKTEIQFSMNPEEWETHKESLTALVRSVYEAWQRRDQGGDSD